MKSVCIVCQSNRFEIQHDNLFDREYSVKGIFSFQKCTECGLMIIDPMPSVEDLRSYYPFDYHGFTTSERGIVSVLYRIVNLLRFREYIKLAGVKGRILDVGCADAPYFDLLKKKHPQISITGVEFKEEIAEKGRKKGRDIITGTIMDIHKKETFDLIIMNNLIEHVTDPAREMKKAYALLKSNGHVLLETPNTDSWDHRIFKKYWGSLHVPRHTYLFSMRSIKQLVDRSGFQIIDSQYILSTDNWALSMQNFLQDYNYTHCKINKGRVWYYKFLLFIFIPLCVIQKMLKKTGAFVITLRKP